MSENEKNYYFWHQQAFEEAIRKIVCHQCPYAGPTGQACGDPDPRGCALFRHLPDFVRIAQRLERPDLGCFRRAVEREVPFLCAQNTPDCAWLDTPECGLDWLLPFVLEAVVRTDRNLEEREAKAASGFPRCVLRDSLQESSGSAPISPGTAAR